MEQSHGHDRGRLSPISRVVEESRASVNELQAEYELEARTRYREVNNARQALADFQRENALQGEPLAEPT